MNSAVPFPQLPPPPSIDYTPRESGRRKFSHRSHILVAVLWKTFLRFASTYGLHPNRFVPHCPYGCGGKTYSFELPGKRVESGTFVFHCLQGVPPKIHALGRALDYTEKHLPPTRCWPDEAKKRLHTKCIASGTMVHAPKKRKLERNATR